MKLAIKDRKEEPLLSREKIVAEMLFEGAIPSRNNIIEELAKKAQTTHDLVVVSKIDSSFGSGKAGILAYVYANKEMMQRIEEKKKLARTGFKAKKEEAAPAEAAQ